MHNDTVLWQGLSAVAECRFISICVQLFSDGWMDVAELNEKLFMQYKAAVAAVADAI